MRRVITGFNATNAAQGQRLGFTYTEMTDSGKTTSDNNKGSMTTLPSGNSPVSFRLSA